MSTYIHFTYPQVSTFRKILEPHADENFAGKTSPKQTRSCLQESDVRSAAQNGTCSGAHNRAHSPRPPKLMDLPDAVAIAGKKLLTGSRKLPSRSVGGYGGS